MRPRTLVPLTSLSLQRISDFGKACNSNLLGQKCCAKKVVASLLSSEVITHSNQLLSPVLNSSFTRSNDSVTLKLQVFVFYHAYSYAILVDYHSLKKDFRHKKLLTAHNYVKIFYFSGTSRPQ